MHNPVYLAILFCYNRQSIRYIFSIDFFCTFDALFNHTQMHKINTFYLHLHLISKNFITKYLYQNPGYFQGMLTVV